MLTACGVPSPTYKVALVGPFEGRLRQIGYAAFLALRVAIRDRARAGGVGGANVTFIAYNDDGDPAVAARVARNVAADPEVLAVIGHLVPSTTLAALDVYTQAGLPVLAAQSPPAALPQDPLVFRIGPATLDGAQALVGTDAVNRALAEFTDISLGAPPTAGSIVAYDAANVALDAIRADIQAHGRPTRAGVAQALRELKHAGLMGEIAFDADGMWAGPE
jgi:ABC-type branched-subunit amino acid transport system substrate-binding protein